MVYIQRRGDGHLETVDEFDTHKEAFTMMREYQTSDPPAHYYLSQRACRDWAEEEVKAAEVKASGVLT